MDNFSSWWIRKRRRRRIGSLRTFVFMFQNNSPSMQFQARAQTQAPVRTRVQVGMQCRATRARGRCNRVRDDRRQGEFTYFPDGKGGRGDSTMTGGIMSGVEGISLKIGSLSHGDGFVYFRKGLERISIGDRIPPSDRVFLKGVVN